VLSTFVGPADSRVRGNLRPSGAERGGAWLAALVVDDFDTVGGVHDRLVLLIPVHLVMLMPGLAKDLNDLAPTSGLTVDTPSLQPVPDTRRGRFVLRTHVRDWTIPHARVHPRPAAEHARKSTDRARSTQYGWAYGEASFSRFASACRPIHHCPPCPSPEPYAMAVASRVRDAPRRAASRRVAPRTCRDGGSGLRPVSSSEPEC
jgi:hypothetical protein